MRALTRVEADEVDVADDELGTERIDVRETARVPRTQGCGTLRRDLERRGEPAREQRALERGVVRTDTPIARRGRRAIAERREDLRRSLRGGRSERGAEALVVALVTVEQLEHVDVLGLDG